MKYNLKLIEDYTRTYWCDPEQNSPVRERNTTENSTDSIEVFKEMIRCYVDPTDYELTTENIKKNFPNADESGIKQIREYYSLRNKIYNEMMLWLDGNNGPDYFRFEFPEELNSFSVCETSQEKKEKQNESSIYLEIL